MKSLRFFLQNLRAYVAVSFSGFPGTALPTAGISTPSEEVPRDGAKDISSGADA